MNKQGRVLQGADPTGVSDSTTAIKALLDLCIPNKYEAVIPAGTYLVSGTLSSNSIIASGALNLRLTGDVTINVDAGATAFTYLIYCYTTAINNSSISGGRLTLNLNSKVSNGIYLRHAGGDGGAVNWGPITVNNTKENGAAVTAENQALLVFGRYQSVYMLNPIIDTVDRVNSAGVCAGITVSEFVGVCQLDAPQVARVYAPGTNGNDADGIKVFSYQTGATAYHKRAGLAIINDPVITDCEVRSLKFQCSETRVTGLRVHRKSVVASLTYHDVSYQIGGVHHLISPTFEYLKDSGVASIPSTWRPVAYQQQCPDGPNELYITDATTITETAFNQALVTTVGASSLGGAMRINGWNFVSAGGLGAVMTSAVVYVDAGEVQAATATHIEIVGARGNLSGASLLGYVSASAANTSKLSFDIHDNENTGSDSSSSLVLSKIDAGTTITQVGAFNLRDNAGFIDLLGASGWVFSANTLKVGCTFAYIRASSTFTGGPAGPAATNLRVQCLGSMAAGQRCVLVTEDTGAALKFYYLQDGTNWRTNT